MMQTRLKQKDKRRFDYGHAPQINYVTGDIQRIETSRGCPHLCPYCKEPRELEVFPLPEITKPFVQILDMNFLWQPDILERIKSLHKPKTRYEAVCGFDHRLVTPEIARAVKAVKFIKVRIAWDWYIKDQHKILDALKMYYDAGYKPRDMSIFMITNWKISKAECERKLDLLKVWGVGVCDCCFDGGYAHAVPEHWTDKELREFRKRCRKHNQLVRFKIDPEAGHDFNFGEVKP